MPALRLSDCLHEGVCIVRLEGRLVLGEEGDYFRRYFQRRIEDGMRLFVLVCDEFKYIDSAGLGDFVAAFTRVKSRGGRMILVNLAAAEPAYHLSRFKGVVEIVPDIAAAFQSIAGRPVEVPARLKFEDRYTVTMQGREGAQKLVVDDRTVEPPKKTEYTVRQIPAVSPKHLPLLHLGGVALGALAILALLILGLAWVAKTVPSVTLFVLIASIAVLFYVILIAVVLLISGYLSEKLAGKLLAGVLGKIPGLDKWIPKAASRDAK